MAGALRAFTNVCYNNASILWRAVPVQLAFSGLCGFSAVLLASLSISTPTFVCDLFGPEVCAKLGENGPTYILVALEASFLLMLGAFSGYLDRLEVPLWAVAFFVSLGVSSVLLSTLTDVVVHPGLMFAGAAPSLVAFLCGGVLREVRQSFSTELDALRATKYKYKAL